MTATLLHQDPIESQRHAEAMILLSRAWDRSGLTEGWPLSMADAAILLRKGMSFDIDADGLADLIDRRILNRPSIGEDDSFEFDAEDTLAAAALLEARQQWLPQSVHDVRKHPTQLNLETCRHEGSLAESVKDGTAPRYDLRHCLYMMTVSNDAETRLKILAVLKAVLEVEHGVIVA